MPLAAPPADLDAAQAAYLLAGARRVHVIGVGGSGASGLARVLRRRGYLVTGSDGRASATTAALAHEGIPVSIGHRAENVEEPSLVVASAAIPEDNAELAAARARGIPVLKYATALAAAVLTRRVIAVAGCHGKTTTTALTAFLLRRSGVDCGFVVGGNVPQLGGNAGEGRAREFVVEACEYDRSFLRFQPAAAAITNVDADHLDYYGSVEAVAQAFGEFASRIAEDGLLVTTADVLAVIGDPRRTRRLRVQTVGRGGEAEVRWMELRDDRPAGLRDPDLHAMRLAIGREDLGAFATRLAGEHNLSNAAMAIVLALEAGASLEKIRETLPEFRGVERRMEVRCTSPELTVVDDYGHHPTEL
ncbi:MAG TPA: Mur ligase family protein, partial [Planctomycetota bacterium]|nr:Mur ligase family protein [Planctomycetota bacterium]